jgi:hypothetical protein
VLRSSEKSTAETKKTARFAGLSEAAEGIRTLDLLHGKQGVWFLFGADIPCKRAGSRVWVSFCDSPAFTASSRGFGHRMGTRAVVPLRWRSWAGPSEAAC